MAQDPLSHVASWFTPTSTHIDASLSPANSEPKEERPAAAEELAAIEFEPIDAEICQRLYKGMTQQETISLMLASRYLAKNKPDLVRVIRKLISEKEGQDAFYEFVDGLSEAKKCLEGYAECLGAALVRLLIASAVIGFGESGEAQRCRQLFEEPMTEAERRLDATLDRLAAYHVAAEEADADGREIDVSLTASDSTSTR